MPALEPPTFIVADAFAIREAMVQDYQTRTGKVLQPAQPESFLISAFAYREYLVRQQFQLALVQMLVAFSQGTALEYLAELVGVYRLPAASAVVTLRFTVSAGHPGVTIPAGTRVATSDGLWVFTTDEQLVIGVGLTYGDTRATAEVAGTGGNGYLAGQVNTLQAPIALVTGVASTDATGAGAEVEGDDALRDRIRQAPNRYSTAGPEAAYRFFAMSASAEIVDVAVVAVPSTGTLTLYALTKSGAPSSQILAAVTAACSGSDRVPMCDLVVVAAPAAVNFAITLNLTLYAGADAVATMAAANAAVTAYAASLRAKLGRDPVDSQIIKAANVDGVYQAVLVGWAATPVAASAWANCTGITLNNAGTTNG